MDKKIIKGPLPFVGFPEQKKERSLMVGQK